MAADGAVTETRTTEIGERLRQWRGERGFTITELAAMIAERAPLLRRLSREYVRRYEIGAIDRRQLDLPYLAFVSEVLGHDVRELGADVATFADALAGALEARP